jgi:hypothetical protein
MGDKNAHRKHKHSITVDLTPHEFKLFEMSKDFTGEPTNRLHIVKLCKERLGIGDVPDGEVDKIA